MLPRAANGLRLNVGGLTPEAAWGWLPHESAYSAKAATLFQQIFQLGGAPVLTVDVDETVGRRTGLECQPRTAESCDAIFKLLVAENLCDRRSYEAVWKWPGISEPLHEGSAWPLHLVVEALTQPDIPASLIARHINHVKVVFNENGLSDAKIYSAFNHALLRARHRKVDVDG